MRPVEHSWIYADHPTRATSRPRWAAMEAGVSYYSRPVSAFTWEPSWEPFSVDGCGRLWTPVDTKAFRSELCGRLWTPVDSARRSTDQEVGVRIPPGVPCTPQEYVETPVSHRGFCLRLMCKSDCNPGLVAILGSQSRSAHN